MDYKITTSEFFSNYEDDFSKHTYQIKATLEISLTNPAHLNDDRIKELLKNYTEAQNALKQMELELVSLPNQTKSQLNQRMRNYKNDLDNLNRQINKAEQKNNETRGGTLFDKETDPKEKFLNQGGKIFEQSKKIEEAKRNMLECEDNAVNIQRELYRNGNILANSLKNTKEVWNEFSKSNRLLSMMNNRRLKNKIVLYVVLAFVIFAIILILYFNFT